MKKLNLLIGFLLPFSLLAQQWNKVVNIVGSGITVGMDVVGSELYISGGYDTVNGFTTENLISYNGANWTMYFPGLNGGGVIMLGYNNLLYIGGGALRAGGDTNKDMLVTWDGANWGGFGSTTRNIKDIAIYQGSLYAVGNFDDVFGVQNLTEIMRHDGTNFYPLTTGAGLQAAPLTVKALAVYDSLLLIGGRIIAADGISVYNLAAWDGSAYSAYAGGTNDYIHTMFTDTINEYLYISGSFTAVGGTLPVNYFAKWDGQNWFDIVGSADCNANDFELYQNQLYAAGCFYKIGGDSITGIARYNGVDWDSLGKAYNPGANIMEVFQNELYVGGNFTQIGDTLAPGLAKWSYPLDSACKEMYAGIGVHPDTIYTGQLPYTFRSGCYGNSSLQWEFSDGYTNGKGHCAYNFNNTPGTYDIMLTAQCGTEADTVYSQVVIVSNAGIEDPMDQLNNGINVTIFPNPSEGNITISSSALIGKEVQVSIYDLQGKQVYQKQLKFSSDTLQLALDLPKGSYELELIEGGKKVVQQIVVE